MIHFFNFKKRTPLVQQIQSSRTPAQRKLSAISKYRTGKSVKQIAAEIGMAERTVRRYLQETRNGRLAKATS